MKLYDFLYASWSILEQLSPWLLLGMLISGLMHALLPAGFVRQRFQGPLGVVKAVLLGVPLPLCSCGVIPAGIGLKNEGADDGAAVGFLISTPQTGVDSILVAVSFFGWPFAIFKMGAALVTGVIGGWLANWLNGHPISDTGSSAGHVTEAHQAGSRFWRRIVDHSLEVFQSFWIWLAVGIIISAAIEVFVPDDWLSSVGQWGTLPAMLLVMAISVPLYVCATASVPLAAALVVGGFPPSAALVFLMAGPATNTTTMGAIFGRFGAKVLALYLIVIIVGSLVSGLVFDGLLIATVDSGRVIDHHHHSPWQWISALLVLGLFGMTAYRFLRIHRLDKTNRTKGTVFYSVGGMTCEGCAGKIERLVRQSGMVGFNGVSLSPPEISFMQRLTIAESRQLQHLLESNGFQLLDVPAKQKKS